MKELCAKDYRRIASDKLRNSSNAMALNVLLYSLISSFASGFGLGFILEGPFAFSFINMSKKIDKGQNVDANDLFSGFNKFGDGLLAFLLVSIFEFLWSLLFIIPGIIKSFSYAMTFYILSEKDLTTTEAITESRKIMDGHKWELFCLLLSYLGWHILAIFTFGILEFWIVPKQNMAVYTFYKNITGRLDETNEDIVFDDSNNESNENSEIKMINE